MSVPQTLLFSLLRRSFYALQSFTYTEFEFTSTCQHVSLILKDMDFENVGESVQSLLVDIIELAVTVFISRIFPIVRVSILSSVDYVPQSCETISNLFDLLDENVTKYCSYTLQFRMAAIEQLLKADEAIVTTLPKSLDLPRFLHICCSQFTDSLSMNKPTLSPSSESSDTLPSSNNSNFIDPIFAAVKREIYLCNLLLSGTPADSSVPDVSSTPVSFLYPVKARRLGELADASVQPPKFSSNESKLQVHDHISRKSGIGLASVPAELLAPYHTIQRSSSRASSSKPMVHSRDDTPTALQACVSIEPPVEEDKFKFAPHTSGSISVYVDEEKKYKGKRKRTRLGNPRITGNGQGEVGDSPPLRKSKRQKVVNRAKSDQTGLTASSEPEKENRLAH